MTRFEFITLFDCFLRGFPQEGNPPMVQRTLEKFFSEGLVKKETGTTVYLSPVPEKGIKQGESKIESNFLTTAKAQAWIESIEKAIESVPCPAPPYAPGDFDEEGGRRFHEKHKR